MGVRFNLGKSISIDGGVFSTLSNILGGNTTDIPLKSTQSADSACAQNPTHFISNLPCAGNATLRPYGAAFIGITGFQSAHVAAVTIAANLGWARTSNDSSAHFYEGIMIVLAPIFYTTTLVGEGS